MSPFRRKMNRTFGTSLKVFFETFVDFASYSQKKGAGVRFETPRDLNLNAPDFQSERAGAFQKNE